MCNYQCGLHLFSKTIIFMLRLSETAIPGISGFHADSRLHKSWLCCDVRPRIFSKWHKKRALCCYESMDGTCSDYRSALHIFAHSRYFQMHYDHNQIISDYIRLYHHTVHPYSVAFCAWVLLEPSGLSSTVGGIAGSQLCREIHGGSGGLVWQWPEGAASMWSQHCEVRVTSSIFQSGRLDIELSSTSPTYDMYRYKYYTLYSVAR